jgi:hypothetical protein
MNSRAIECYAAYTLVIIIAVINPVINHGPRLLY